MLKSIWNRIRSLKYISMPLFLMRPTTENYEITNERKFWTHEIPSRKNFGPTKYPRENFRTHEIPTKEGWHDGTTLTRPTMARDPRNLANSFRLCKCCFKYCQYHHVKVRKACSFWCCFESPSIKIWMAEKFCQVFFRLPISSQCTLSLPPENIKKPYGFLIFSGARERVHWEKLG